MNRELDANEIRRELEGDFEIVLSKIKGEWMASINGRPARIQEGALSLSVQPTIGTCDRMELVLPTLHSWPLPVE